MTAIEGCAVWSVAFTRFVYLEMLIGLVCNWTTQEKLYYIGHTYQFHYFI